MPSDVSDGVCSVGNAALLGGCEGMLLWKGTEKQGAKHQQHNLWAPGPRALSLHPHQQEKHVQGRIKGQRVSTAHTAKGSHSDGTSVPLLLGTPQAEVCGFGEVWPMSHCQTHHGSAGTHVSPKLRC